MADTTKPKTIKMNTPKGVAKWPKLSEPDYGTADYPKPEGEYSVKLMWEEASPEFQAFQKKLQPYVDAAEAAAQAEFDALKKPSRDKLGALKMNSLFTPIYDDAEEPTGMVEMKLTMKASGTVKRGPREGKKWTRSPDIYDAAGRKLVKKVDIWGGSELIISFTFVEGGYFIPGTGTAGLKMQLDAIQIITLRQGGARSAADHGFGKEDGFDSSEYAADEGDTGGGGDEFANTTSSGGHTEGSAPAGSADF